MYNAKKEKNKTNPGNTKSAYRNRTIRGTTHKHQMTMIFFSFFKKIHTEMKEMNKKDLMMCDN